MAAPLKLGVLVSGRGSNLQAIMDAIEAKRLDAEIRLVVSDQADAYALERAGKRGIPTAVFHAKDYSSREEFDRAVVRCLRDHQVELVCLAGFMRILSPDFIRQYKNRILNIHPALLPAFPGLHVQRKALEHGVKFSGCTVHFVDEGMDTGPIIIQAIVPVLDGDDEEALAARILRFEHQIYPKAIQLIAEGRLQIEGRRVLCKGSEANAPEREKWGYINP
ncbi:MAG: phosphoribosylglycinamide formyltransferase [candidate division NC10 bacterium]|nr:phosphoribosylglycinamide formyltransferase [candidate division NC10 bacterium]